MYLYFVLSLVAYAVRSVFWWPGLPSTTLICSPYANTPLVRQRLNSVVGMA